MSEYGKFPRPTLPAGSRSFVDELRERTARRRRTRWALVTALSVGVVMIVAAVAAVWVG